VGASPAVVDRVLRPIERAAADEGLTPYHAVERKLGPTDLAHEVLAYATSIGRGDEIWGAMFRYHFGRAGDLWTVADLLSFAGEAGLDRDEVEEALRTRSFRDRVDADQREAVERGVRGTPFLLVDGHHAIPGAVGLDELRAALAPAVGMCTPDACY
jgi:predicted DsbA family dithiol-disulfide isomerase